MICPKCGKDNSSSVRFCEYCGVAIEEAAALSDTDQSALRDDTSRYQEYTMTDVQAKKSHKKLIIILLVAAAVIVLGLSTFFIIRAVNKNNASDNGSGSETADQSARTALANNQSVLGRLLSPESKQKTSRVKMTMGGYTQETIMSSDLEARKYYYKQVTKADGEPSMGNASGPAVPYQIPNVEGEFYTTKDRGVFKMTIGDRSVDYYLDYNNLRKKAETSAFGPKGENVFGVSQQDYDQAMDCYEYVYNNLMNSSDPFALRALAQTMRNTVKNSGKTTEANEKIQIDGTETDARVITTIYSDMSVVKALLNDVKAWAGQNVRINPQINAQIDEALDKLDTDQLDGALRMAGNAELKIRRCLNNDGLLMQAELEVSFQNQRVLLRFTAGSDPANTRQIKLEVMASMGASQGQMTLQTITVKDESTNTEEKLTASYSGFVLSGSTEYVRDIASGDFSVKNNVTVPMAGLAITSGPNMTDVAPEQPRQPDLNFTINGNLQKTEDSITARFKLPDYDGESVEYELYVSDKAEINELTSQHDLLKASADELKENFFEIPAAVLNNPGAFQSVYSA